MKSVKLYTDGACSGNPGPGGYAAILIYGGHEKVITGGESETTNNRMELAGVIQGLKALREPCDVEVVSDSKYVCDGMNKSWAEKWRENGWKRSGNAPALNPDLWGQLLDLSKVHQLRFTWVRGHADNQLNNKCDELAVAEIKKLREGIDK